MRWLLALACVVAFGAVGCSGPEIDDPPDSDEARPSTPAGGVVADGLVALFAGTSPDSADAAACFGNRLATARSSEQLSDDGILDESGAVVETLPSLDHDAAAAWVEAWFGCVDFTEVAGRAQKKVTKTLDVPAFEDCFRDRLTDAQIREAATDGLSGDASSPAVRRLSRAQQDCAERHG
ncbi:MAG: hypothetical protein ABWX84_06295 [Nocardioides sp.]